MGATTCTQARNWRARLAPMKQVKRSYGCVSWSNGRKPTRLMASESKPLALWQWNGGAGEWPEICTAEDEMPQRSFQRGVERICGLVIWEGLVLHG